MVFSSLSDVWAMAGHGPYVWSAYGVTLLTISLLLWLPQRRARQLRRDITGQRRREQRQQAHSTAHPKTED